MLSDSVTIELNTFVPKGGFRAWLVCLSAGLFFFYEFFQLNLFDVINQSLRTEFQMGAAELSWMSSAYLWADILFLLPAGVILDRFSIRKVIFAAMSLCVVGTFGFALTHSFGVATACHFLTGIGNAFCFLACVVLVSRWFPPRRRALVIGCIVTLAFSGGMIAHTPFAYLTEWYGWRQSLLMDGAFGLLLIFWFYFSIKDTPDVDLLPVAAHQKVAPPNFLQALVNRQNWSSGLYTACLNLPIMVLCALWGANYLQVVHQLSPIDASNVVSLIFMGSILSCPLVGWLSDRMGRRKPLMMLGAIATCLTVIPLVLGVALSEMALSILFFLLGVFTSTQVISYPLIAGSNPSSNTGAATGVASVLIMGGGAVGQILFGWLMQFHSGMAIQHYTPNDFQFAMWMFPIAGVVALLAMVFTQETFCERCD